MNRHKHADKMAAYAADAMTTFTPWVFWQFQRPCFGSWNDCDYHPEWVTECNYRRKPKQHTVTLNTAQIKEILMVCEFPSWENEDFKSGVLALEAALGVQPKTNAQIACDMLGQAHDALEEHSAEICEPNVDHIQKLVLDAIKLLEQQE
jgi:hypothetical protein